MRLAAPGLSRRDDAVAVPNDCATLTCIATPPAYGSKGRGHQPAIGGFRRASSPSVGVDALLCSVADVPASLAGVHRVLRPDGELRLFEHVASPHRALRAVQRAADATLWPRLSGGCHLGRDTDRLIESAGFEVVRCEQFSFRIPPLDPPKTHILGVARRVQPPDRRAA